jgi:hypothetical protein
MHHIPNLTQFLKGNLNLNSDKNWEPDNRHKTNDVAFPSLATYAAPTDRRRPYAPSRCSPVSPSSPPIATRPPSADSRRAAVATPTPPRGFPLGTRLRLPPHPNPHFRTPTPRVRSTKPPHRSQGEPSPRPPPPGPRVPFAAWGAEGRPRRR